MGKGIPTEDRFWAKVDRTSGVNACWIWTAHRYRRGYGQFWDGSYREDGSPHNVSAHRWSFERFVRQLRDGECVLHRCDNPPCVNPAHLFAGSHKDNAIDRESKKRGFAGPRTASPGEKNGSAKLTAEQVVLIRERFRGGASKRGLAREFGVSAPLVFAIVNRKLWRHIPD